MVVGGVALTSDCAQEINDQLQDLKQAHGIGGELKWSRYTGGRKRAAYEGAVDLLFKLIEEKRVHFHSICCDFRAFDHKKDGAGNPEKSVNKLYYQLLLHRVCAKYGGKSRIIMFPDHGNDSAEILAFRGAICASAYKRYNAMPNCLRDINPVPSKEHNVLQIVDIVIGAIAAQREDRQLGPNKSTLRDFVVERSGISDFSIDTPKKALFSVWNFNWR